jgi:hypothetical protein
MLRIVVNTALAIALLCTAGATSALASTPADPTAPVESTPTPAATNGTEAGGEGRVEGKLKGDFSRLVADARAGKVGTTAHPRQQPAQSNNLSKKAKVTIAVVVVAVVITAIVVASKANNGPGGPGIGIF